MLTLQTDWNESILVKIKNLDFFFKYLFFLLNLHVTRENPGSYLPDVNLTFPQCQIFNLKPHEEVKKIKYKLTTGQKSSKAEQQQGHFVFPLHFYLSYFHLLRWVSAHPNSCEELSVIRCELVPGYETSEHLLWTSSVFSIRPGSKDWKQ